MSNAQSLPLKCTGCQAEQNTPIVCIGCHTLYPVPQSADHFTLLGVERTYDLDESALAASFRSIARNVHPDRFADQSEQMRTLATRLSAEVNRAYQVLRDPVLRADYLLELAGGPSAAEEREAPGELLMEVMELREELEQARARGDRTALERLQQALRTRRRRKLEEIAGFARQIDAADERARRSMRRALNSMKYFDNLLAERA